MANIEGAVRMRRAGKFLILGGMASMLFAVLVVLVASRMPATGFHPGVILPLALIYLGLFPELVGIVLWIAGWILEGFLMPSDRDSTIGRNP